jgi:hypothetical protein
MNKIKKKKALGKCPWGQITLVQLNFYRNGVEHFRTIDLSTF